MQATFGGDQTSVRQLASSIEASASEGAALEQWLSTQIALPATLVRSHFRQRANPRLTAPLSTGGVRRACEVGSRWHRHAFTKDDEGKVLNIIQHGSGNFQLLIDSQIRAEISSVASISDTSSPFYICNVDERAGIGGNIKVGSLGGGSGRRLMAFNPLGQGMSCTETLPNPAIAYLTGAQPADTFTLPPSSGLTLGGLAGVGSALVLECEASPCAQSALAALPSCTTTLLQASDGTLWRHDPRLQLVENTLDVPSAGISAQLSFRAGCPNVAKTIFNRNRCVLRDTCARTLYTSASMALNVTLMREFFLRSGKYIYAIDGLRLEDAYAVSPCDETAASRWRRQGGACSSETGLDASTKTTLAAAIRATSDANPYVRDVMISSAGGGTCNAQMNGVSSIGASVTVDGVCWTHVHPQQLDVLDFSYWSSNHEGNKIAEDNGRRNPITAPAELDSFVINFPSHHLMQQFKKNTNLMAKLGRLGDVVDFALLPTSTQTDEVAQLVGALGQASLGAAEACGSAGESANLPTQPHVFGLYMTEYQNGFSELYRDYATGQGSAKGMAWASVVTGAQDQLRHRSAWALSQIIVLSHEGVATHRMTEVYLHFYDLFVRHAFGNYKELLREVSYSPAMAKYLTFLGNKGFVSSGTYPDENYAREVMQVDFSLHDSLSTCLPVTCAGPGCWYS